MNDNVIQFTKKTITASPANRKPSRSEELNAGKIAAHYAPVPAWVAAHPVLNRSVTFLRERGWRVDCYPDNRIICYHSRVQSNHGVNIIVAMEIQIAFNRQSIQGGAA